MTDECKQFDSLLMDLAYGELPEHRAEELRNHAEQCATCRAALDEVMLVRKMSTQLPPLEPTESMDAIILHQATEAADQFAKQKTSEPVTEKAGAGLSPATIDRGPSLQERLRAFFLSPALATAAVVALVLVISFFLVQKGPLQDKPGLEGNQIAFEAPIPLTEPTDIQDQDDAEEEASPAAEESLKESMAPSKPFEPKSEQHRASPANMARRSAPKRGYGSGSLAKEKATEDALYQADYLRPTEPVLGTTTRKKTGAMAPKSAAKRKDAKQQSGLVDDAPNGLVLDEAREEAVAGGYPAAQAQAEPTPKALSNPPTSDFRMGTDAYTRGDCKTATAAFTRVLNQPSSVHEEAYAIHHLGACEKRQGRCAKAIRWYERLFAGYPRYKNMVDALREGRSCYLRLGQTQKAQSATDRINRIMGGAEKLD